MANAWGELSWNQGLWGAQGDVSVSLSGNSLAININQGWGLLDWNSSEISWGGNTFINVAIGQQINVTGLQLNTSLNSVTEVITVDVFLTNTNLLLGTSLGDIDASPDAIVTGQQLNLSTGTLLGYNREGWGRYYWGEEVWGDSGIWETVSVTGQQLNLSLNSVTPIANANIDVTGEQLNVAEGEVDPSPDATVTGIGMTVALAVGTVIAGEANVFPTGQQINLSLNSVTADANTIPTITGFGLTSAVGTVFAGGNTDVSITGIGLTVSLNSINNQIWTVINTGSAATWTEIDTAA